ncbi:MAG: hypothetical protein PF542_06035 [Nanoarchaeota archaeon]|jgi:hypothetical protein|nr:hypothetical protein [Nanoarchaeota archaeon]
MKDIPGYPSSEAQLLGDNIDMDFKGEKLLNRNYNIYLDNVGQTLGMGFNERTKSYIIQPMGNSKITHIKPAGKLESSISNFEGISGDCVSFNIQGMRYDVYIKSQKENLFE